MTQALISRRERTIFQITSFLFLGVAAAVGFIQTTSTPIRGAMVALLLAMAVLQLRAPGQQSPSWQIHLYLGLQAIVIAVLMFLVPGWTMFPTLYGLLSVQTILLLSPNPGLLWIAAYVLITVVSFALSFGWEEGFLALPIYGGLNAFFGAYANALLRAHAARQESQALLDELRQAHDQLQEYALRVEAMAVVEERNRLAREMHDTLGHRLTVASVQLEGAQRLCSVDPDQAASMVNTVRQQVRQALSELRSTVATLRTPIEADLRLHSSLRRLIADFQEATSLTVHQVLPEDIPELPGTHRLALFRAVQEALTNVQKHAQATQVWLLLTVHSDRVSLLVSDDGKGISIRRDQAGFGLRGLRERAAQLGGELHLEPRRGGGTQLSLRLPLPPPHLTAGEREAPDTVGEAIVGDRNRQYSEVESE